MIDREKELQILRRLGKKNIGPRILGTFRNGRFEEYFEARPLTHKELRMPETAKQVAKRMRELHEGITLLEEEREGGPMIFKNWDKWVDRCEQVTTWLDKELESPQNEAKAATEPWRRRGYVCGVTWDIFRKAVENYRKWLIASSGGLAEIKRQLVFAHNDVSVVSRPILTRCIIDFLLDPIWQSPSYGARDRITLTFARQRTQAARRYRLRVFFCQYPWLRVC